MLKDQYIDYRPPPPPPDPLQFSCKRQLEKIGGDPSWYLSRVKSSDINDGSYHFPNAPEGTQEVQQVKKSQSALRRLVEKIVRCIRGPFKPESGYSKEPGYVIDPGYATESSLPPSSGVKVQTWSEEISPQKQCSLLSRLPIEVRHQIYEELFSDQARKWHLSWPNKVIHPQGKNRGNVKLAWSHCPCPKRYLPNSAHHWCISHSEFVIRPDYSPRIEKSFLFTCRQAYVEASPILYSKIIFGFESPNTLRKLTSTLSTPLLHSITSLDLEWEMNNLPDHPPISYAYNPPADWKKNLETSPQPQTSVAANLAYKRIWDLLASFEGLKRLRVRTYTYHDRYARPTFGLTQGFERLWLDPMLRFEGLETFCLAINEPFFGIFEKERERMGWKFRISNIGDGLQRGQDEDEDDDDEGSDDDF